MDPFQQLPFPGPLSLVLLVLVTIFVSILVTFLATKQRYLKSTLVITTVINLPVEKNTTAREPQHEQRQRIFQEPLSAADSRVQEQPPRAQPIPIPAPNDNSPVAWRPSFDPNMLQPRTRPSLPSSLNARKGSCARCSLSSSSDGDNSSSGSEGSGAGSVGSGEIFFGNMGAQF
ncbi:hypothetical protein QBC40DRAFT_108746 [Triangularia verruculosa]|uniref:Uncharacterized protein n=1 Tax=Triangularia verruculosa TaxID=2587418 RepID=A0AAN6XCI6_9PEZI|nr:hypothetical protein QBC40DRAFT_108746 [Triangularia verruculosa]